MTEQDPAAAAAAAGEIEEVQDDLSYRYLPLAVGSGLLFMLLYKYGSPWFSSHCFDGYNLLSRAKQIDWNTRVVSSVHAIFSSILCLYVLVSNSDVSEDPAWGDSTLARLTCAVVLGYLTVDLVIILKHYAEVGEFLYVVHHGLIIMAKFFVVTYGALQWFAMYRLMAELSTPFVNQRWFFDSVGYDRSSKLFLANGIAMAGVFFMVRIAVLPLYYYKVYVMYGTEGAARLGYMWYLVAYVGIILDLMNVMWFHKMLKGARKVIRNNRQKKATVVEAEVEDCKLKQS